MRISIKTNSGKEVDFVNDQLEVKHQYYILIKDLDTIWNFMKNNNFDVVSNQVASLLMEKGLIRKNDVPF